MMMVNRSTVFKLDPSHLLSYCSSPDCILASGCAAGVLCGYNWWQTLTCWCSFTKAAVKIRGIYLINTLSMKYFVPNRSIKKNLSGKKLIFITLFHHYIGVQIIFDQTVASLVKDNCWYCLFVGRQQLTLAIFELHQFPGSICFSLQPKRRNSLLWC